MGGKYIAISVCSTAVSFCTLHWWSKTHLQRIKSDGLVVDEDDNSENFRALANLLLGSYTFVGLLLNFVVNTVVFINLCLKTIFFSELYPSEIRKLVERLLNYAVYKGTFLPVVIPPTLFQVSLWSIWLTVLCSLKMIQAVARDRLERLNASPSHLLWAYSRVYSALLFVLACDVFWIQFCYKIYSTRSSAIFLLLFFEPLSIAFETMQAILIHGFHLVDIFFQNSTDSLKNLKKFKPLERIAHGSLSEWKGILVRDLGFALDLLTLIMALSHCLQIWWLRGMVFHFADAILLLNIRALLSAIFKRIKGFLKLKMALSSLDAALPDATPDELTAYDDECAICREPMAKAKKLHCKHLFHLSCLRSWLDQASNEHYSCPNCRKPLFASQTTDVSPPVSADEQLARQINETLNSPTLPDTPFSGSASGSSSGPAVRPAGLGRVHMMMSQLGSMGEDWNQMGSVGRLRLRRDNFAHLVAMSEMVREILPHVPDEMILQDLQRTNSVAVTVNNLLMM